MPPKGKVRWLNPAEQAAEDAAIAQANTQSLNQLLQIFHGQIDDEVIRLIFHSNNQSLDQSLEVLSSMVDDTPKHVRESVSQSSKPSNSQNNKPLISSSSQWARGSVNQPKQPVAAIDSTSLWPSLAGDSKSSRAQPISQAATPPVNPLPVRQSPRVQPQSQTTVQRPNIQSTQRVEEPIESIWDPPVSQPANSRSSSQSSTQSNSPSNKQSTLQSNSKRSQQTSSSRSNKQPSVSLSDPSNQFYTIRVLDSDSDFEDNEITSRQINNQTNKLSINQQYVLSTSPTYQTITNGTVDPMHYLQFIDQSLNQMRDHTDEKIARQLQMKLSMEPADQSAEHSINQSNYQSVSTFPELSLEQLKLDQSNQKLNNQSSQSSQSSSQSSGQSNNQPLDVDREGLMELLCMMFDSIDRSLIEQLLDSVDHSDVQSLNEVVETLTSITAEEQLLNDDDDDDQSTNQSKGQSSYPSLNQSVKLGAGDQKLELTDLEIAQRMATDSKWSPPRATRSLKQSIDLPNNQQSNNQSNNQSRRFIKSKATKLDLTKPVYAWPTNNQLTDQWKIKSLKSSFRTVDPDLIDEIFACNQSNYQQSIDHLKELFPEEYLLVKDQIAPIIDQTTDQSIDQSRPKRYSAASIASRVNRSNNQSNNQSINSDETDYEGESLIPDSVMEYELGAILDNRAHHSNDSAFTRQDAAAHANRRALFFRAATACYYSNRGSEAQRFAKLGHEEGSLIMETSVASAAQIFRANNKNLDCSRKIDLHGLHVKEAICFLDFAIRRLRKRSSADCLIAVTGRGVHSVGGRSRLKPAIQRYCERHRYRSSQIGNAESKIIFG